MRIATTDAPSTAALDAVDAGLCRHNDDEPALAHVRRLCVFATADDGRVVGGAVGRSWGECCELQQLWVSEALRGQGLARRLVGDFEREARRRGCRLAYLDTFSFQAPALYEKLGYRAVLVTRGFTGGIEKYTLHKQLLPGDGP
ncbi:MAG TPA: GNAT family N-acetyltransferase [Burkholderiaceae bacterium]|nr:GNAT family N-acetyltransferase [Burkholderiaceae bacterium]